MTKILIIEDNHDIQALLSEVLAPNYQVLAAFDGITGLKMATEEQTDLIILDLMLPNLTGESVLKTLRRSSTVPIIVLTAIQDKQKTVALLRAGANDYLTKPFDLDELTARIEVQLRQQQRQPSSHILSFAEIKLDLTTHQVWVNQQPLTLPKKEFLILALLLRHPHQVFAKAQLYETVWGDQYQNAENTLNVHLSNLRVKINELATEPQYIISIWGIGVRLI